MNDLERAFLAAVERGCNHIPNIWYVPSSSRVEVGAGENFWDGTVITSWEHK